MLELSAPTPPIVDYLFGTGLMGMFIWTVGSFDVFGEKWDLTLFLPLRFNFFENTLISTFIFYLQRSIIPKLGKALIFLRFPFGKGSYFLEIPILRKSTVWLIGSLLENIQKIWIFPISDFPHIWIFGYAENVPRHIPRFQF